MNADKNVKCETFYIEDYNKKNNTNFSLLFDARVPCGISFNDYYLSMLLNMMKISDLKHFEMTKESTELNTIICGKNLVKIFESISSSNLEIYKKNFNSEKKIGQFYYYSIYFDQCYYRNCFSFHWADDYDNICLSTSYPGIIINYD